MYQTIQTKFMTVKDATEIKISSSDKVIDICKDMSFLAQESFQVLTLNAKNILIDRHMITLGLANATLIHSREIFRPAIQDAALSIILIHNHPSGDTTPSPEDLRITKKLIEAGKIIDIEILDHIIIGKQNGEPHCMSLKEEGICSF